jgi:hypothetical protein
MIKTNLPAFKKSISVTGKNAEHGNACTGIAAVMHVGCSAICEL